MTSPNSTSLRSAINELRDIVSRSQEANEEGAKLLGQIESLFLDLEGKAKQQNAILPGSGGLGNKVYSGFAKP